MLNPTHSNLLQAVIIRFAAVFIVIGALIFVPAGSLDYRNGWVFMISFFIPMCGFSIYLFRNHRSLLEKRLKTRENEKQQQWYVKISLIWFVIAFLIPGFDYRFGWSNVPLWLVIVSTVVMISGYSILIAAMVQNSYASRVIEIQEHQHVIDTGLYSVVRHPMYLGATIMYIACPLVLGSFYGLIPALLLPPLLAYRLLNEESVLRTGLTGYTDYCTRVRYRLIPFVW